MKNLSQLTVTLLAAFTTCSLFAQCPVGSPCAQRSANQGHQNSNYDGYYNDGSSQNHGYGYYDESFHPGKSRGYPHAAEGYYQDLGEPQGTYNGYPVYYQDEQGRPTNPPSKPAGNK